MEHKILRYENGRYFVDIDITVNEWKAMLLDENVFYPEAKNMILRWYVEEDHQATSKTIMTKYNSDLKGTPYNGIVKGLSQKVLDYLDNRFWVEDSLQSGKTSYWCIPFEGWHLDYNRSKNFVWKLREELVEAIDDLLDSRQIVLPEEIKRNDFLENTDPYLTSIEREGKRIKTYTIRYERNPRLRRQAVEINRLKNNGRLKCDACGFDFEEVYGERGKNLIEVHHNKPLYLNGEREVDPKKDLDCVCSNCHRIIHKKDGVLSITQLKQIMMKVHQNK